MLFLNLFKTTKMLKCQCSDCFDQYSNAYEELLYATVTLVVGDCSTTKITLTVSNEIAVLLPLKWLQ